MSWARLTWFREHGYDKVHPEDRALLEPGIQGRLVKLIGAEGPWQRVILGKVEVRVHRSLLTETPPPRFDYGARVRAIPPRTPVVGEIDFINWHFKREEPFYFLSINGKLDSSQYWSNELSDA
jgi:hypothetical protein